MAEPHQLILDLGFRAALGAEDFLVGRSNEAAVALIDSWPDWPASAALVVGPQRSGKTHLAHVWQHRSHAHFIQAHELSEERIGNLMTAGANIVVEDIDQGIGYEAGLFHILNLARESLSSVLMTSTLAAGDLTIALPDLRSRLRAAVMVEIAPPDDGLLGAVLVKHFADRQLLVEPAVIAYLVDHMERSLAAAAALVEDIDRRALASRRKVTRTLAGEVLVARSHGGTQT
ncbi:MAG: DnaA/Hda family protein [Hyphomicrobiaceae bacterium]